jgi:hypothetical protein
MNWPVYKKLRKVLGERWSFIICSVFCSAAKAYGVDTCTEKRAPFQNFLPEPLLNILGVVSIVFGAIRAWQQKRMLPLLFFGSIGIALIVI